MRERLISIRAVTVGFLVLTLAAFFGLASFFISPITAVGVYIIGSALIGLLVPRVWYVAALCYWPVFPNLYDHFIFHHTYEVEDPWWWDVSLLVLTLASAYTATKLRQSWSRAAYWMLLVALSPYLAWSARQAFIIFRQPNVYSVDTFSIGSRVAIWLIVGITAAVLLIALMKALLVLGRVDRTPMH